MSLRDLEYLAWHMSKLMVLLLDALLLLTGNELVGECLVVLIIKYLEGVVLLKIELGIALILSESV